MPTTSPSCKPSLESRMPGLPDSDITYQQFPVTTAPSATSLEKKIHLLMPFPRLRLTQCTQTLTMMFWQMASELIMSHRYTESPLPTHSGVTSLMTKKAIQSYVTSTLAAHALSFQSVFTDVCLISSMVSFTFGMFHGQTPEAEVHVVQHQQQC